MMNRWLAAAMALWIFLPAAYAAVPDEPFRQETVKRFSYKDLGIASVQDALVDNQGQLWVLADAAMLLFRGGTFQKVEDAVGIPVQPGMKMTTTPGREGVLAFAGPEGLYIYNAGGNAARIPADLGAVNDTVALAQTAGQLLLLQVHHAHHVWQVGRRITVVKQGPLCLHTHFWEHDP
ncbi:MAG TPA: hypothetical protein PK360_22150, partial [bacterium]|nr:hypothetical protein [bacterium]